MICCGSNYILERLILDVFIRVSQSSKVKILIILEEDFVDFSKERGRKKVKMGILLRPTTSEVRALLQKIKMENLERGLSLNSAGIEKQKFELLTNRKHGYEFQEK